MDNTSLFLSSVSHEWLIVVSTFHARAALR